MSLLKSASETLENDFLRIEVKALGAELCSVFNKHTNKEMIWQADPGFWGRHAPVLFPFVGRLRNNQYEHEGNVYPMSQHGFARNNAFQLFSRTSDELVFRLDSDEESLSIYPFSFSLFISYKLTENCIIQSYEVKNNGAYEMLFSIGAHPAFALDHPFSEYKLSLSEAEPALTRTTLRDGLLDRMESVVLENDRVLNLNYDLFESDAIVLESMRSTEVSLFHLDQKVLAMNFTGFPFFGIWTKPNAPFLCLEPWLGIADQVNSSGELREKKGIMVLAPNESKKASFSMTFY